MTVEKDEEFFFEEEEEGKVQFTVFFSGKLYVCYPLTNAFFFQCLKTVECFIGNTANLKFKFDGAILLN
jgi:hypothetical protein